MIYCTNCGNKIISGSNYCGTCGHRISSLTVENSKGLLIDNNEEIVLIEESNTTNETSSIILDSIEIETISEVDVKKIEYNFSYIIITFITLFLLWGSVNGILNVLFYYNNPFTLVFIVPLAIIALYLRRVFLNKRLVASEKEVKLRRIVLTEVVMLIIVILSPLIYEILTGYFATDINIPRIIIFLISIFIYYKNSIKLSKSIDNRFLLVSSSLILLAAFIFGSKDVYQMFGVDNNIFLLIRQYINWYKFGAICLILFEGINYYENTNRTEYNEIQNYRVENVDNSNKKTSSIFNGVMGNFLLLVIAILMVMGFGLSTHFGREIARYFFGN